LPPELTLGPVKAHVDERLLGEARRAQADVEAAITSERYFALLNNVERIVQDPPLHAEASPKTLRKRARRAANKATKRLAHAFDAGEGQEADVRLHSARKATKRARAAELVRSVIGKRAKKQAQRFEELQDILGEHQDSVITAEVMRTLGAQAGSTAGENGFTYGLLSCREQQRAARTREQAHHWLRQN
jgi:CHAD domain-containing protein